MNENTLSPLVHIHVLNFHLSMSCNSVTSLSQAPDPAHTLTHTHTGKKDK